PKRSCGLIILRKNDTTTPRRPTRASSGDCRAAGSARVRMPTLPSREKYYRPTRARTLRRQAELLDCCWWALVLLMGGAVAVGLAGCGGGRSGTAPQPGNAGNTTPFYDKVTVNYAFIPRTAGDPFFEAALHGALQAKRDLETADPKLEIVIASPSPDGSAER